MTVDFSTLGLPERARPLAKLIHDYDDTLTLERLPIGHPWLIDNADRPYALVHRGLGMQEYVVESYPESMLDARIMGYILEADIRRAGKDVSKFDTLTAAQTLLAERKNQDRIEEANDRMAFARKGRTHF